MSTLTITAHHKHGAVGVAHHAVRDTPQHCPSQQTEAPAPNDYHLRPDLLGKADDLGVRTTHRDVGFLDFAVGFFDLAYFYFESL